MAYQEVLGDLTETPNAGRLKWNANDLELYNRDGTFTVASQAAMLSSGAKKGDIAVRLDLEEAHRLVTEPATQLANWVQISTLAATTGGAFEVQTLTTSGTVDDSATLVLCQPTSGALIATLHTAVGFGGTTHTIKHWANNTNLVTLDAAGSETIDGLASLTTTVYRDSVTIQSDNANWIIISPPTMFSA
jgi:hypothetical protein